MFLNIIKMVKYEIKVDLKQSTELRNLIEKSYFEDGFSGKIIGKKHFLEITKEDDVNWTIFKDLHNATCKVFCEDVIDGSLRFLIESGDSDIIKLYPISIYCIREEDRFIFY